MTLGRMLKPTRQSATRWSISVAKPTNRSPIREDAFQSFSWWPLYKTRRSRWSEQLSKFFNKRRMLGNFALFRHSSLLHVKLFIINRNEGKKAIDLYLKSRSLVARGRHWPTFRRKVSGTHPPVKWSLSNLGHCLRTCINTNDVNKMYYFIMVLLTYYWRQEGPV